MIKEHKYNSLQSIISSQDEREKRYQINIVQDIRADCRRKKGENIRYLF